MMSVRSTRSEVVPAFGPCDAPSYIELRNTLVQRGAGVPDWMSLLNKKVSAIDRKERRSVGSTARSQSRRRSSTDLHTVVSPEYRPVPPFTARADLGRKISESSQLPARLSGTAEDFQAIPSRQACLSLEVEETQPTEVPSSKSVDTSSENLVPPALSTVIHPQRQSHPSFSAQEGDVNPSWPLIHPVGHSARPPSHLQPVLYPVQSPRPVSAPSISSTLPVSSISHPNIPRAHVQPVRSSRPVGFAAIQEHGPAAIDNPAMQDSVQIDQRSKQAVLENFSEKTDEEFVKVSEAPPHRVLNIAHVVRIDHYGCETGSHVPLRDDAFKQISDPLKDLVGAFSKALQLVHHRMDSFEAELRREQAERLQEMRVSRQEHMTLSEEMLKAFTRANEASVEAWRHKDESDQRLFNLIDLGRRQFEETMDRVCDHRERCLKQFVDKLDSLGNQTSSLHSAVTERAHHVLNTSHPDVKPAAAAMNARDQTGTSPVRPAPWPVVEATQSHAKGQESSRFSERVGQRLSTPGGTPLGSQVLSGGEGGHETAFSRQVQALPISEDSGKIPSNADEGLVNGASAVLGAKRTSGPSGGRTPFLPHFRSPFTEGDIADGDRSARIGSQSVAAAGRDAVSGSGSPVSVPLPMGGSGASTTGTVSMFQPPSHTVQGSAQPSLFEQFRPGIPPVEDQKNLEDFFDQLGGGLDAPEPVLHGGLQPTAQVEPPIPAEVVADRPMPQPVMRPCLQPPASQPPMRPAQPLHRKSLADLFEDDSGFDELFG